jgi:antitoxin ParD1/3/4
MSNVSKMSITVTHAMAAYIDDQVSAGRFSSASEAIREALRVWKKHEDEYEERIAEIRASINRAIDDPRPRMSADAFREEMNEYMANFQLPKQSA